LVCRGQELTLLLDRWEQAQKGEGQVVLLAGEPGIGKSRLVQALRDRLAYKLEEIQAAALRAAPIRCVAQHRVPPTEPQM
jgi:predicted ATPase